MAAFIIWSIVAVIFALLGISAWKSEQAVGFFTFVKPLKATYTKKYNRAVGKLWLCFALGLEALGVPLLRMEQNSPLVLLVILGVVLLVISVMAAYMRIERKYSA